VRELESRTAIEKEVKERFDSVMEKIKQNNWKWEDLRNHLLTTDMFVEHFLPLQIEKAIDDTLTEVYRHFDNKKLLHHLRVKYADQRDEVLLVNWVSKARKNRVY
jgi:flagellar motility protein MotE (MotC chaperone)